MQLSFSKDETIPEHEHAVIDNKPLSEAVLETMIGEIPVSPALKESLATRFHQFFKELEANPNIENWELQQLPTIFRRPWKQEEEQQKFEETSK